MNSNQDFKASNFGYDLCASALKNITDQLMAVCFHEKRRLAKMNEPTLNAINLRLGCLKREREELAGLLKLLRTPLALRRRWRFNLAFAMLLGLASVVLGHLTLAPFGLGWEAWLLSVTFAGVGAYWTDVVLQKYHDTRMSEAVFVAMFLVSLAGLVLLALLRGDLFGFSLMKALVPTDDASATTMADAVRFYTNALLKVKWSFAFLTLASDIATGLAIFEVQRIVITPQIAVDEAARRIREIEVEAGDLIFQRTALENVAEVFEQTFRRNVYTALLDGIQQFDYGRIGRFTGMLVLVTALAQHGFSQPLRLVTGLDFSKSEESAGYSGVSAHDQDVESAARLISRLPPGAKVTVSGITDSSFSRPLVLLTGEVPNDPGQLALLDRITIAKTRMAAQLRNTARSIPPSFPQTDVLGFLVLVGQTLREAPKGRRALVIYSDMRHSAAPVNIETPKVVSASMIETVERQHMVADLSGVDVWVLGVHAVGKDVHYWQSLRDFWSAYFTKCGANLRAFSMMRDVPDLGSISVGETVHE